MKSLYITYHDNIHNKGLMQNCGISKVLIHRRYNTHAIHHQLLLDDQTSPIPNLDLQWTNTLRPRQDGRHFADDIFKCIFLNWNVWIPIKISLKFVPKGGINNIPALVQIMTWRRPGDKSLSEQMMVSLLTHICVTRPQWVNSLAPGRCS